MTTWHDTDAGPVCADCWYGCPRPPHWAGCDRDHCLCPCRDTPECVPDGCGQVILQPTGGG